MPRSYTSTPPTIRFLRKMQVDAHGCWNWKGYRMKSGYGTFTPTRSKIRAGAGAGSSVLVHRWAYEQVRGPVPEGKQLDHRCRNRGCANPWHLEAVTAAENLRRGREVNVPSTCPQGHSRFGTKDGARYCLDCNRNRSRAHREAHAQR